jgi:putative ABC transport system permease protein
MLRELVVQSWANLARNRTRSLLTMLGIVWGIVAVAVLMAYGSGFRALMLRGFDAFGKSVVVVWPGQTSEQAGGERAGRPVRVEKEDKEQILAEATMVKTVSLESIRYLGISYGPRLVNAAIRGVDPPYGEMRSEVADEGRWISPEDLLERRRVVFLGGRLARKLFSGRPAVGETVRISGVRFAVVGVGATKIQLSSYFAQDDESAFIPYTAAGDIWNTRYATVLVFSPLIPSLEGHARRQVRAAIAKRQRFSASDKRAMMMIGRQEFRPIIDGIVVGLQGLLLFIGTLTLTIGGVGVANIMPAAGGGRAAAAHPGPVPGRGPRPHDGRGRDRDRPRLGAHPAHRHRADVRAPVRGRDRTGRSAPHPLAHRRPDVDPHPARRGQPRRPRPRPQGLALRPRRGFAVRVVILSPLPWATGEGSLR